MLVYIPQTGQDPRALSQEGSELWTPTLVGRRTLVSNLGRLYTEDRGIWTPDPNKSTGYRHVYVRGHGKVYVHWLVLASFEGEKEGSVARENGDKGDNRLFNLFWR